MRICAKIRSTIEVIVVKAAPRTVTTIAAGRRNSRRSPVAMMARTRSRRPRRGSSRREYVGREIDILRTPLLRPGHELQEQLLEAPDLFAHVPDLGSEGLGRVEYSRLE